MPSTITAYNTFVALTKIKSSEVNANFSNHRGDLIPIHETTATAGTTGTYNLGTSEYTWLAGYVNNAFLAEYDTTTSAPTPASGFRSLFTTSNDALYSKDDAGAVKEIQLGNPGFISTSTSYSLTSSDKYASFNASSASITVSFLTASAYAGKEYIIKKTDSTFNDVLLAGPGGTTITSLNTIGESVTMVSDGTNWVVQNRYIPHTITSYTPSFSGVGTGTSTSDFYWSRIGQFIVIEGGLTVNTAWSGSQIGIGLPSGLTGVQKQSASSAEAIGGAGQYNINGMVGYSPIYAFWSNANQEIRFVRTSTGSQVSGTDLSANDELALGRVMIPIQGWKG